MDTYILLRDITNDEIQKIANSKEATVWVSKEVNTSDFTFPFNKIEIHHDWMQLASNIIKSFPHKVYGGKKLVEHLKYKSGYPFFLTRFILFSRFYLANKEACIIEEMLHSSKSVGGIFVFASSPYLRHFEFSKEVTVLGHFTKLDPIPKFRFLILSLLRTIISITQIGKYRRARHLFLNPPVKLVPIIDKTTLKPKPGNPPVEYFLEDLLKIDDAFVVEEFYPLRGVDYSFSKSNLTGVFTGKTIFLEPFLVRAFLKSDTRKDQKDFTNQETALYNLVNQEEKDPIIKLANQINFDLRNLRKLAILRIAAANLFFKPSMQSFGCIDEHSMRVKSLLEPAKNKGIKTYAIQHGIIHRYHHSYVYLPEDHDYITLPDISFVFGKQAADILLTYGNFPEDALSISGQLRTDIISKLSEAKIDPADIGLDPNKPTILFASQPEAAGNEKELIDLINLDFFKLTKEFPQYQFVLKPHPREIDFTYYYRLAESVNANNFKILTTDLYYLLNHSSLVLINNSTVGTEVVFFNKPLVIMDYTEVDMINYISSGVGIKTTNLGEVKNTVERIMSGALVINQDAYDSYKNKYTGTIDGKVSERILNTVIS